MECDHRDVNVAVEISKTDGMLTVRAKCGNCGAYPPSEIMSFIAVMALLEETTTSLEDLRDLMKLKSHPEFN